MSIIKDSLIDNNSSKHQTSVKVTNNLPTPDLDWNGLDFLDSDLESAVNGLNDGRNGQPYLETVNSSASTSTSNGYLMNNLIPINNIKQLQQQAAMIIKSSSNSIITNGYSSSSSNEYNNYVGDNQQLQQLLSNNSQAEQQQLHHNESTNDNLANLLKQQHNNCDQYQLFNGSMMTHNQNNNHLNLNHHLLNQNHNNDLAIKTDPLNGYVKMNNIVYGNDSNGEHQQQLIHNNTTIYLN